MRNGIGYVGGIPIDDCGDDEIEAGSPILLGLATTIDVPPLAECADCLREGVAQRRRRAEFASQSSIVANGRANLFVARGQAPGLCVCGPKI